MSKIYESDLGTVTVDERGGWDIGSMTLGRVELEFLAEVFHSGAICRLCLDPNDCQDGVCSLCHERLYSRAVENMFEGITVNGERDIYEVQAGYATLGMSQAEEDYIDPYVSNAFVTALRAAQEHYGVPDRRPPIEILSETLANLP